MNTTILWSKNWCPYTFSSCRIILFHQMMFQSRDLTDSHLYKGPVWVGSKINFLGIVQCFVTLKNQSGTEHLLIALCDGYTLELIPSQTSDTQILVVHTGQYRTIFFPRLFFYVYIESPNPKRPHTTGPKPQLKTPTPKTQYKT